MQDGTAIGGASFVARVHHAAAVAKGGCRVDLVAYGGTARSQMRNVDREASESQ